MSVLRFENFEIQLNRRQLVVQGQVAELGARAFDLLVVLAQKVGAVVSKADLLEQVWPNLVVEENNLQVQIHTLRKCLGTHAIATVPGRGYRLMAKPVDEAPQHSLASEPGAPKMSASPVAVSVASVPGNFPVQLDPMYGREHDAHVLQTKLAHQRLVTILGPGGRGKSTLALHVAWSLRTQFAQGVWWLDLASVQEKQDLVDFVAQTLGLSLPRLRDAQEELIDALQSQNALLVLDGCEHLVVAVADWVRQLLHRSLGLRILVTSQERLRLLSEWVYQLDALPTPEPSQWQQALEFGAVRLFCTRVQAQDRRFSQSKENIQAAIQICQQLDGNALAIELAAARVPMLGFQGVLERLNERLELLTTESSPALSKHVSLLAALEWSHQLLSQAEAEFFRRLGVFKDGFSLEVCQIYFDAFAQDDASVLDLLNSLIERSLVTVSGEEPPRFRLLETNRTYALHKLDQAGETSVYMDKFARAMRALCRTMIQSRNDKLLWQEMNNIRKAMDWVMAQSKAADHELAIALAVDSAWLLAVGGQVSEALTRLLQVQPWVDDTTPPQLAARYWQWLARCGARGRLPTPQCMAYFERAEQIFETLEQARHIHACRRMRAEACLDIHDVDQAQKVLALAQAQETPGWPIADRLRRLRIQALIESAQANFSSALATAEFALSLAEADQVERYVAILRADMAGIHMGLHNHDQAVALYQALLSSTNPQYFHKLTMANACGGLIAALLELSQPEAAAQVCQERMALMRRSSLFMSYCDVFARLLIGLGHTLPAARFVGAANAFFDQAQLRRDPLVQRAHDATLSALQQALTPTQVNLWQSEGVHATESELASQLLSLLPAPPPV
jgi:predicted ATPase/DNA-binding winged helix-turn-helix (wHTH) protein